MFSPGELIKLSARAARWVTYRRGWVGLVVFIEAHEDVQREDDEIYYIFWPNSGKIDYWYREQLILLNE